MSLYSTAVSRPVATFMFFTGVLVLGIYSLMRLPLELYPEIDPPNISVITAYPGAGPLEVEQNVTEELENVLSTVNDLDEMSSVSIDNTSVINLEFSWDTDLDVAANDVRDALGRAQRDLPDDIEDPVIFRFSTANIPILVIGVTAGESFPNIREILENDLVDPMNRIKGVGAVSILGSPERIVRVKLDRHRLQAYNLDVNQIVGTLEAENIILPAGDIQEGDMEYNIRTDTEFENIEEIGQVVVANLGNQIVYLRDVALVEDATDEEERLERVNRERGVRIVVQKQSGANTVNVANAIRDALPEFQRNLPPDVHAAIVVDNSDFIINSILSLQQVLIFAIVFVVLVVWVFLRRWRATFIVALCIPFSLIGAFIYLALSDNTLNLISLSSLSIALGMVVDDAIVVFENIATHVEKGSKPKQASVFGTEEVGFAVIATTLTVISVFFPLTLLSGITGVWFSQLGYIVCITVAISTFAALSLVPMLSSVWLKNKPPKRRGGFMARLNDKIEKALSGLDNFYTRCLKWALQFKLLTILIPVLLFIASLFLLGGLGTEFIPSSDSGRLSATIELRTGTGLQTSQEVMKKVEEIFYSEIQELTSLVVGAGIASEYQVSVDPRSAGTHVIDVTASFTPAGERERSVFEIGEVLRNEFNKIPEVIDYSLSFESGGGPSDPIEITVLGSNMAELANVAEDIAEKLRNTEGARGVEVSRGEERPELEVDINRERLSEFGMNSGEVAQIIRSKFEGATATEYREEGEEYDIVVQYAREFRSSIADLRNMPIERPDGTSIRLMDVADVRQVFAPPLIEHLERERAVTVSSDVFGASTGEVMNEVRPFIDNMDLPPRVEITYGGDYEEQQQSFQDLSLILILSIILVYLVMAGQFESLRDPFIIMLSIPFAFTGVLVALFVTGTNLSVIAFVGGIMLIGIVVKNAIVLVDYTNLLRHRGQALNDAVVNAGKSRLRPVLMTTLTTILAMTPLAVSQGEGSEVWKPMAIAVIGGLAFSTLITLIFVPVMYAVFEKKTEKRGGKKELVSP